MRVVPSVEVLGLPEGYKVDYSGRVEQRKIYFVIYSNEENSNVHVKMGRPSLLKEIEVVQVIKDNDSKDFFVYTKAGRFYFPGGRDLDCGARLDKEKLELFQHKE